MQSLTLHRQVAPSALIWMLCNFSNLSPVTIGWAWMEKDAINMNRCCVHFPKDFTHTMLGFSVPVGLPTRLVSLILLLPTSLALVPPPGIPAGSSGHGGWAEGHIHMHSQRAFLNPVPRTGDQHLLIALVDFPDRKGYFTGEEWFDTFFGEQKFDSYFREVSYDQLRYTGTVVGLLDGEPVENSPEVAYIRLPNPITYYANGNRGFSVGSFPQNGMGVADHAAQALDDAGFDFGPFADENNKVQNFIVVFAGIAAIYTGNLDESLEATAYRISSSKGQQFVSKDGYEIDNYTFCPEQRYSASGNLESGIIAHQGICVHEHGHALGMPDLYDYGYKTTGVGEFDLMGYGTYGGDETGKIPFHFGAFSKAFLGWVTPTVYDEGSHEVTLKPIVTHPDLVKLYPDGDENASEYFLLSNLQMLGFDKDLDKSPGLCAGLVIWHVDDDQVSSPRRFFRINSQTSSDPPNPGVTIEEADGNHDLISSPLNFGECKDIWQVGDVWTGKQLLDGSPTYLSVEVNRTDGHDLVLRLGVGRSHMTEDPGREECNMLCAILGFFRSIFDLLFGWLPFL